MSCRVIGRTIETAILHFLEDRALTLGAIQVTGECVFTERNAPCKDLYERHGYHCTFRDERRTSWNKSFGDPLTVCPDWIKLEESNSGCLDNCKKN
jgi:predicted enzyme involved in methoxymalonyl-ACP biosynthesis